MIADGWAVANINVGILYIFAISSLQVYGVIMAGWASNSKYAFLAALRSAAQMVSYEVSIGFVIITVLLCAGSLNLNDIDRVTGANMMVRPPLPCVPGMEVMGVVAACGAGSRRARSAVRRTLNRAHLRGPSRFGSGSSTDSSSEEPRRRRCACRTAFSSRSSPGASTASTR